ncbi:hypothetical protein DEU56DRAFT_775859 [Suillus clintonianus]|uniref:uncharacterized protein n=1 Tax=Suillus clintonianus TaxID=1904413 RepID=UPI001B8624E1|nr:uncharacterized protein DEU56DRAFT_775859 [Suillus clintonianus]KAG2152758.1 hypothetical protein DEU56DRAFT_775859 [Suillus clintonianus]
MNINHNGSTTPACSKHLSLLNTSSSPTAASSLPSPPYSPPANRSTPPTSAHARGVSPNDATKALKATRRQSSISYVSSRVDVFSRHGASTHTTVADGLIGADTVLGTGGLFDGHKRTSRSMKRRTMAGLEELRGLNAVGETRAHRNTSTSGSVERAALTLAEKHADLLHAIAAAESRRLELTGQLAAVEGDLGELKRKWERIVNREPYHPTLPSSTPTASVVDGLKEGVRLLAAGLSDLSDLSSPIPSPAPPINIEDTTSVPRRHAQRVSDSSTSASTRSGVRRLSRSSVSSIWDEDVCLSSGIGTENNERNLMNQSRDKEVARERQEKVFRRRSRDLSHPPTAFTRHATSYNSTSTSVDLGRGSADLDATSDIVRGTSNLGMDASVTAVGISSSEIDADGTESPEAPSKNTLRINRSPPAPPSSMPGAGSLTVVGGGWGNVGRKLGGDVFSKSQKRASILLSDVSQSIVSALTPGPVATSPAPVPTSIPTPAPSLFPFPSSLRTPSSSSTSLRGSSVTSASSSFLTPSSNTSSPLTRSTNLHTRNHIPAPRPGSWLEDEEEDTVNAGRVMMPSVLAPTSASAPALKLSTASTSTSVGKTLNSLAPTKRGTATATSFDDDDDWNW